MRGLQGWEIPILLLIVLLLFGASRLPAVARSIGKSVRILKHEVKGDQGDAEPPSNDHDGAPRA